MEDELKTELTPEEEVAVEVADSGQAIPIVGIGASAGGLKALGQFFEGTPANSGMAFVVIVHLSPDYESHLATVLQNVTEMPVLQISETTLVEPNKVYVIPPNKHLSMIDGHISLSDPERPRGKRVPVDLFFRTLAETHGPYGAAVVLSGSGTDGTVGLARIKEYAGVVAAQDPTEAEYPEMPRSAIDTGLVDYVLPAGKIVQQLSYYWEAAGKIQLPPPEEPPRVPTSAGVEEGIQDMIALLRARTGRDYTQYKRSTILRRMARRMQVTGIETVADYLVYLREHPDEVASLEDDLLISVTNFFRDPYAFATLANQVIPSLFRGKYPGDSVRVWVPGCATGEEAYSIAILLRQYADTLPQPPSIQIFATDVDQDAIAAAREGSYREAISADVSPDRLARYFVNNQGTYRIKKEIRETILFAVHNLLKDPPFSRIDLISCRNLLIYLNRSAQAQVLETFHFALRPDGYLFLGNSETVEGLPNLFLPINKHEHIFGRLNIASSGPFVTNGPRHRQEDRDDGRRPAVLAQKAPNLGELHRSLLEQYGPPSVLVDHNNEIVHLSYNIAPFLHFTPGEPSHNLLKVALPELSMDLRAALYAADAGSGTETRRVRVPIDGTEHLLNLIICPVQEPEGSRGLKLVFFDDLGPVIEPSAQEHPDEGLVVRQLEEELQRTREQLSVLIEQYETSAEELKASNEELQAINEELRSTSEELETSKEELQALNEELQTVNQELKHKVEEVSWANNDLQNLLTSTNIGTMFLDRELHIKRFTPQVQELFNIILSDVNRPLAHLTHKLNYNRLPNDAAQVLQKLTPIEREVRNSEGKWFMVRLLPYRTIEDKIDGVVMTFVDITDYMHTQQEREALISQLAAERTRFEAVVEQMPAGLAIAEAPSGKVIYSNRRAQEWWGAATPHPESIADYSSYFKGFHPDGREYAKEEWPLTRSLMKGEQVIDEEAELVSSSNKRASVLLSSLPVRDREGRINIAIQTWFDITAQKKSEEGLRQANDALEKHSNERTSELLQANMILRTEAIEREQAQQVRQELMLQLVNAQEEERKRISQELHDELGQLLTGLKFILGSADRDSKVNTESIKEAQSIADTIIGRVREIAANLRPSVLDDIGLIPALLGLIDRYTAQTEVQVDFRHSGLDRRFSPEIETAIYRVVQEALTNVARHAKTKNVSIDLVADGVIAVRIEDSGVGFEVEQVMTGGANHGLAGMRERMRLVGGDLTIESTPGKGTILIAEAPYFIAGAKAEAMEA